MFKGQRHPFYCIFKEKKKTLFNKAIVREALLGLYDRHDMTLADNSGINPDINKASWRHIKSLFAIK